MKEVIVSLLALVAYIFFITFICGCIYNFVLVNVFTFLPPVNYWQMLACVMFIRLMTGRLKIDLESE